MQYTIIINNKSNNEPMFRVHKFGCRDVGMECHRLHTESHTIEGETVENAIEEEISEYQLCDQGFSRKDYQLAPCMKEKKQ